MPPSPRPSPGVLGEGGKTGPLKGKSNMGGRDLGGLPSRVERFIGGALSQVEQIFRQELESRNPYVADIFAHVAHFRGKRLRPMLLLLSASATGPINEAHRVLGAVVEVIHTATLVHDD